MHDLCAAPGSGRHGPAEPHRGGRSPAQGRAPSPDDERVTLTAITEEGRARVARVMPGHVQVVRRLFLAALDERDLRGLREIMTRVRDHMRNHPPRSAVARKRRAAPGQAGPRRGAGDR